MKIVISLKIYLKTNYTLLSQLCQLQAATYDVLLKCCLSGKVKNKQ